MEIERHIEVLNSCPEWTVLGQVIKDGGIRFADL